jgi:hypothetical protein
MGTEIAKLVGRRADDPELTAYVTGELKKKIPASVVGARGSTWVEGKKQGVQLLFAGVVRHDLYPEIPKGKALVPYLSEARFDEKWKAKHASGVLPGMERAAVEKLLGPPDFTRGHGDEPRPVWQRPIDPARGVVFEVDLHPTFGAEPSVRVDEALDLTTPDHPARAIVGLFVAWAVQRKLLDETRLAPAKKVLADVAARRAQGSALVATGLARGLWDRHLRDTPGLRHFAHAWFHNIGGAFYRDDLVAVFGERMGPHGHKEPVLDDDDWKAVDRATKKLDAVFKKYLRK